VPVEACRLGELVDKPYFDLLAFFEAKERPGHLPIIAPDGGWRGRFGQKAQIALPRFKDTETVLRGGQLRPRGQRQNTGQRMPEK
jgi:hypothetical protein